MGVGFLSAKLAAGSLPVAEVQTFCPEEYMLEIRPVPPPVDEMVNALETNVASLEIEDIVMYH
jgi:hypothetical protein